MADEEKRRLGQFRVSGFRRKSVEGGLKIVSGVEEKVARIATDDEDPESEVTCPLSGSSSSVAMRSTFSSTPLTIFRPSGAATRHMKRMRLDVSRSLAACRCRRRWRGCVR